jgi:hypothetical protein
VTENTLFSQDEQKHIAERLRGLAKHVSDASSLSEAQKQILNEKIDYLVCGSRRLGRKDWLNTFIGVTLGYLLSTVLPPMLYVAFSRPVFEPSVYSTPSYRCLIDYRLGRDNKYSYCAEHLNARYRYSKLRFKH